MTVSILCYPIRKKKIVTKLYKICLNSITFVSQLGTHSEVTVLREKVVSQSKQIEELETLTKTQTEQLENIKSSHSKELERLKIAEQNLQEDLLRAYKLRKTEVCAIFYLYHTLLGMLVTSYRFECHCGWLDDQTHQLNKCTIINRVK